MPFDSGWAQAFVAVLAIGVGAGAIYWQTGRQRTLAEEDRVREEVRRLKIIASGVFHCRARYEQMRDGLARGLVTDTDLAEVKDMIRSLRQIPALEVPEWRASFAIWQAGIAADHITQEKLDRVAPTAMRKGDDGDARIKLTREALSRYFNVAIDSFKVAENILQQLLTERGSDVPNQTVAHSELQTYSASAEPAVASR